MAVIGQTEDGIGRLDQIPVHGILEEMRDPHNMRMADLANPLDRRAFLRLVSAAGAAGLVYPHGLMAALDGSDPSRVVLVSDDEATSGLSIDEAVVQNMADCAIVSLTRIPDVGEAWRSLFPGIGTESVIAVKINCRYSSMPTHVPVTFAVVNGLRRMDFSGTPFPENNIIIYDLDNDALTSSGYTLNTSSTGVRCFGSDQAGVGYSTETYNVNGVSQRLSRIVTEMADYLVNISVLKNHGGVAGVTLCLKNHLGTCDDASDLHGNHGDPYIPALNALAPIRDKQCINVCDALFGVYSGGPGGSPQFAPNTLIMSRDIVAVDYWGREILEDAGCSTIWKAHHVDTAAGAPYNLGTNDPAEMDIVNLSNPAGLKDPAPDTHTRPVLEQNIPNPFRNRTRIPFHIPVAGDVNLTVFDATGRRVCRLVEATITGGRHWIVWDGINDAGTQVAAGTYYCRLQSGAIERAIVMQLVR
jgi:hypothetical protein